jgi:hypothetical protein
VYKNPICTHNDISCVKDGYAGQLILVYVRELGPFTGCVKLLQICVRLRGVALQYYLCERCCNMGSNDRSEMKN